MSSPYPVLDNKRIDQWKVTELKEELKRRKLTTKGLKEDLIKRLDEAIRNESESEKGFGDNGFECVPQPVVQSEDARTPPIVTETTGDIMDESDNRNEETRDIVTEKSRDIMDESDDRIEVMDSDKIEVGIDDGLGSLGKEADIEGESIGGTESTEVEGDQEQQVVQSTSVETSVVVSESVVSEIAFSGKELPNNETQNKSEDSNSQLQIEDSNPLHEEAKLDSSELNNQVFEVSQVKSDSISTDTVSINEKNELKDNVIADDVKLELDVKPEMAQPSSTKVVLDDGKLESVDVDKLQSMDVEEPHENKVTGEETDCNNADMSKKNDSGDVGSAEKLNLDRSSGDDSMEEDALESKQIDSTFNADEVGDGGEKIEVPVVKEEEAAVGVMGDDLPAEKKIVDEENKNGLAAPAVKRKFLGLETAVNNETTKRPRRWNTEGLKVLEPQSVSLSPSTTPKDAFQPTFKRSFSRSDSTVSDEAPKERVVPPSSKPSTNSLRIDRFLRPFTLKAVQELLGKTGTVTSFWMDHIKTHCFVTYSSVDEAVETRNAVYNLQWPPNGGRLLVADFVDPQEVKVRAEAPKSPATPVSTGPTLPPPPPPPATKQLPEPSPRVQVQRQQLPPPLPLPPPPPLSNPPPARERLLPPPPPLPEKVDPPIVTLDDLFRKTKATPRIYYLPLSDEQVAAKPKAQGENVKQ